ncbi:MAG: division/cell wall cluster transcriptional repressor MraZ [Deltaproteobacteria bacterium]|nr:MAG: division/cell wall cluster transcriptional repressor MraZ [Deltaproteobacteria bacterium]
MLRTRCQATVTLDNKGRIALPAVLRRALEGHDVDALVLTFHTGAVWAWTLEDFEQKIEAPILRQDPFKPEVLQFTRAVLAPAQEVEVDKQGRIRIPPMLRELARLEKEVVVNSMLDRLEFWDRETWNAQFLQDLHAVPRLSGMPGGGS